MVEIKEMPLTIYGLLARRHNTDKDYVYQVVSGIRKGRWGKGAAILADWNKLKDSFDDWITEYKPDGSMIVNMEDIHVSVYVQNGIARIYKRTDLMNEADVRNMNLDAFRDFLNGVRIEFN
jgi:hypothetical protein